MNHNGSVLGILSLGILSFKDLNGIARVVFDLFKDSAGCFAKAHGALILKARVENSVYRIRYSTTSRATIMLGANVERVAFVMGCGSAWVVYEN